MLWTLLKVLIFVGLVAALAFGANRIIDMGEGLRIVLGIAMGVGGVFFWVAVQRLKVPYGVLPTGIRVA